MRRVAGGLFFLSIVLSIWGGMHFFVWTHVARQTALPGGVQMALGWTLAVLAVATFVTLLRVLPQSILGPMWTAAFVWAGFLFLLFFLFLFGDLAFALAGVADPHLEPVAAARAEAILIVGLGVFLAVMARLTALGDVPVKRVEVTLEKLPQTLSGFSIVQITDLHVSPDTRPGRIRQMVERVNALAPDLIALTGDLVDGTPELLRLGVAPLGELKARHGAFFVTGNHEYFSGADRWIEAYRKLGFRVLHNERVTIGDGADSFELAGVPDWRGGSFGPRHRPRLPEVLANAPTDREIILLAHQPRQFPEAAKHGVGLQLSGHTHGGQLWPFTWLIRIAERYVHGLHRIGRSQLYVSRGTGFWGPAMRLFAPMEITQITLRAGAPATS
jgi:predicted MPP superfamily phosphohydrolase